MRAFLQLTEAGTRTGMVFLRAPWTAGFRTSGPQSCEMTHFCCLKPLVCGTLSQQSRKRYSGAVIHPGRPVRSPTAFMSRQTKPFVTQLGFPRTHGSARKAGGPWSPPSDVGVAADSFRGGGGLGQGRGRRPGGGSGLGLSRLWSPGRKTELS